MNERQHKKEHFIIFSFILSLVLMAPRIPASEIITIRVWLFQAAGMEDQPGLKQTEILSAASHSEIAAIKAMASGPENEFRAAVIDTLTKMKNLRTLDDLFISEKTWEEERPNLSFPVLGKGIAFQIDLSLKKLNPRVVGIRAVVSKTKEGLLPEEANRKKALRDAYQATLKEDRMEKFIDQELLLGFDDPIIVGVPYKDKSYFMMVVLTQGNPESGARATASGKAPSKAVRVASAKPIHQVLPAFPDELRRRGIEGGVGLQVTIDEKGSVQFVELSRSLHPYLDYSTVQAFQQWTFRPVLFKDKPVRAIFDYIFYFDFRLYPKEETGNAEEPANKGQASQSELWKILDLSAEYCRKLAGSALFFICEETISETHHQVNPEIDPRDLKFTMSDLLWEDSRGGGLLMKRNIQIMDPRRTERNIYICDYQLIKKRDTIEEQRIVLRENGRKIGDPNKLMKNARYSVLKPIFASLQILDRDHQPLFNYAILDEEKVFGKRAYVIEAIPKSGDADGVRSAKIWVEKNGFQILKCEIEGIPLDGYEDVLTDCIRLNIKPVFLTTHEYRIEKNGVLFPERSMVRVEYRGLYPGRPAVKLKTDLTYDKYKFFTVDTQHEIIK
jgi:TonB family protein